MNGQNNVFYISPMQPEQQALEAQLKQFAESDGSLHQRLKTIARRRGPSPSAFPIFICATLRDRPYRKSPNGSPIRWEKGLETTSMSASFTPVMLMPRPAISRRGLSIRT
jgi:hypothetical protein